MHYQTRQHRRLMDESELALSNAAQSGPELQSRIARHVLGDSAIHRLWESRHAELLRPISEESKRVPQVIALRHMEVRVMHRGALINHLRRHSIVGEDRDRLFRAFYPSRDKNDAILMEHRQFMLAMSSQVSADHLIDVMRDPVSRRLLRCYETSYTQYFELYCFVACATDAHLADATKVAMLESRRQASRMRKRLYKEKPDERYANFERQELLARSGRYKALNYLLS